MASTLPRLAVFQAMASHNPESTAVLHSSSGRLFTYGEMLSHVARVRDRLRGATGGGGDLAGRRIAFLVENSYDYAVTLLAVLAAGSIAVPLSPAFPASELQYVLNHSETSLLLASAKFAAKADELLALDLTSKPARLQLTKHAAGHPRQPVVLDDADTASEAGLMLYTSGTTNRPKGVLLPHAALTAQSRSLIEAWDYSPSDRLLHLLPLHHIHGAVNALLTPLVAGASVEFLFPFNADAVWRRLAAPFAAAGQAGSPPAPVTLMTAVPTVYSRLLATHAMLPPELREPTRQAVSPRHMRLAISGSAALPTPVKAAWRDLSRGNVLLERYGMTEVGMALSCGLDLADRVDASVGWPLPSVQVRLVDLDAPAGPQLIAPGCELHADGRERAGEIQLCGPTLFREYWRDPDATASQFVSDPDDAARRRWFRTGDLAIRRTVPSAGRAPRQPWARGPMYFILGRVSIDIIKTGGEKVSALEVERELLALPQVAEAAVVAVPSGKWGQKVGAVVILSPDLAAKWSPLDMRRALRSRLANYKIPQTIKVVDHIPRNAMGKINKKHLVQAVFAHDCSGDEM